MGNWLEVARSPNWFEKIGNRATANYSLNPDGTVNVFNRSYDKSGKLVNSAKGKASIWKGYDKPTLGVKFFLFEAEYRIEYINDSYDLAIVGNSKKTYFWILSRSQIAKSDLFAIINYLDELGYKTSNIIIEYSLVYNDDEDK